MKITFDTKEILSESDIVDIAKDEVRREIREQLTNKEHGLANIAYYIRQSYVDDIIQDSLLEIKEKVAKGVESLEVDYYMLDRNDAVTNIIRDTLELRKSEVEKKANDAINSKLSNDNFYDDFEYRAMDIVVEKLGDVIYEAVSAKFKGKE